VDWQATGVRPRAPQPQAKPRGSGFHDRVTVAACLAAASTAILTWVENDGKQDLPDLMEQAFDILSRPQ
jgi:hypothetical protein